MDGYCVKCRQSKPMKNTLEAMSSNGRKMMKGVCPDCGTKMNKFLG